MRASGYAASVARVVVKVTPRTQMITEFRISRQKGTVVPLKTSR